MEGLRWSIVVVVPGCVVIVEEVAVHLFVYVCQLLLKYTHQVCCLYDYFIIACLYNVSFRWTPCSVHRAPRLARDEFFLCWDDSLSGGLPWGALST